jgi:mannitol operon repressor
MMQELAQVILRPDDRLSDMQAIMEQTRPLKTVCLNV